MEKWCRDPAADYSSGARHVLAVIHEILDGHRRLEQKWTSKKVTLHQRLALKLFKEDVQQVRLPLHILLIVNLNQRLFMFKIMQQ